MSLECSCFAYEFILHCEYLEGSTLREYTATVFERVLEYLLVEICWKNVSCSGGGMSLQCTAIKIVSRNVSPGKCLLGVILGRTTRAGSLSNEE